MLVIHLTATAAAAHRLINQTGQCQYMGRIIQLGLKNHPPTRGAAGLGSRSRDQGDFHNFVEVSLQRPIKTVVSPAESPCAVDYSPPPISTNNPLGLQPAQGPDTGLSNTRALTSKVEELQITLQINSIDMAAITETWLSHSALTAYVDIEGYTVFRGVCEVIYPGTNPCCLRSR